VLHYAQEIFEGLKAYRHADGSIWTFRPDQNAAAPAALGRALALPELPGEYFIESLQQLIAVDGAGCRRRRDRACTCGPFMFAKEAFLGVRPRRRSTTTSSPRPPAPTSTAACSPCRSGSRRLRARRQGRHGRGEDRRQLRAHRCCRRPRRTSTDASRCVFLDAGRQYVEELGGMNVVLVYKDGTLVTPESDSILEGITRDSILQLAEDRGHKVEARAISLDEWRRVCAPATSSRCFACGTAASSPRSALKGKDFYRRAADRTRSRSSLREELTDIQYGAR
jgi:branched-chain amino acid aminotransferase